MNLGEEMSLFRKELLASKPAAALRELRSQMSKPEGVKRNLPKQPDNPLPDEGYELYNGHGEDLHQDDASENVVYSRYSSSRS